MTDRQLPLFGEPETGTPTERKSRAEKFQDYWGFVDKFKPKRTTDDCITPPYIYEAVKSWVSDSIMPLDGVDIVRPFWPGADYESLGYPPGCLVLDNPPFSISTRIRRFYQERGIQYFLFANHLTLGSARGIDDTKIIADITIEYENGAKVNTDFYTNLDCGGTGLWVCGSLHKALERAVKAYTKLTRKTVRKLSYPPEVASAALLGKIAVAGIDMRIAWGEFKEINRIEAMGRDTIFGGGWLLSERAAAERAAAERAAAERAAAERAAAERAAAERAAAERYALSETERETVRRMGNKQ